MEEPIRNQPEISRTEVIEVVPVQQLVKHSFINESDKSHTEEDA